ncbi:hypothetical protein [Micromonospora sp. NPDC047730]
MLRSTPGAVAGRSTQDSQATRLRYSTLRSSPDAVAGRSRRRGLSG